MCLSYCWGQADFIQLTGRSLEDLQRGVDVKRLPRVFREFIQVARDFGVRYVWIDSLCILQDSEEDWQTESGKMADIYNNSFVTVAATGARNPHDMLFSTSPNLSFGSVHCRIIRHFPYWPTADAFPLLERGWALQERILSPRTLHFGPDEISWECLGSWHSECRQEFFESDLAKKADFFDISRSPSPTKFGVEQQNLWRRLIVQYSHNRLTKSADKLPALSGIAEVWKRACRQDYLAGLWSGSLVDDLVWYASPSNPSLGVAKKDHHKRAPSWRAPSWRAPSWSWAALDIPVAYDDTVIFLRKTKCPLRPYCKVLAATCVPIGKSTTGQISSGFLELMCPIMTWEGEDGTVMSIEGECHELEVYFDDEPYLEHDLSLVRVATHADFESSDFLLILSPVEGKEGTYQRVGLARCDPFEWPREAMKKITII
jgi:hypothetical protein